MFNYLLLYLLLVCLSLGFLVVIDLEAGVPLGQALNTFHSVFSAVTPAEKLGMLTALAIPFLQTLVRLLRSKQSKTNE
jgi:preprotein translocase subunit SecG